MKGTIIVLLEPIEEIVESNSGSSDSVFCVQEINCKMLPEHLHKPLEEGRKDLSWEQAEQFQNTLFHWKSVFAGPNEVGRMDMGTHKIQLSDEAPIKEAPRKFHCSKEML